MTGKQAYEEDLRRCPIYPHTGKPRPRWDELSDVVKCSWNKNPTPRDFARTNDAR